MNTIEDLTRDAVSIARAVFPHGIGHSLVLQPVDGRFEASVLFMDCSDDDHRKHRLVTSDEFSGRCAEDACDALIAWLDDQRSVRAAG